MLSIYFRVIYSTRDGGWALAWLAYAYSSDVCTSVVCTSVVCTSVVCTSVVCTSVVCIAVEAGVFHLFSFVNNRKRNHATEVIAPRRPK